MNNVTLLHGDCLTLLPTLPAASIDLVLADLPYGTTACAWDSVLPLDKLWKEYKRVLKPRGAVVLTASQPFTTILINSNLKWYRHCWYWQKERGTGFASAKYQPLRVIEECVVFSPHSGIYTPQMEPCEPYTHCLPIYKSDSARMTSSSRDAEGNRVYKTYTHRHPTNLLMFARDYPKHHPTQKPVALMAYLIRTYSNPGDTVLDNTMGSGTTGVAAVQEGRAFIGIEQDAAYYRVACARIAAVDPLFQEVAS